MASAFHEETRSAHISPGLLLVDSRCICFRIMPRRSLSALFSWFLCPSIPEAVFLFFSQVNPAVSSKWPTQALGVQGQGCGLPGTSFLAPATVLGAQLRQLDHSRYSCIQPHHKAKDLGKLWVHVCRGAQDPATKVGKIG